MASQDIVEKITSLARDRFIVRLQGEDVEKLSALADEGLKAKKVVRLQRISKGTNGWRTFLIVSAENVEETDLALHWSASCREELLDPEASDLYLIILPQGCDLTIDECINIESSEKFCRKFVLRPQETIDELLGRTFLIPISSADPEGGIQDPLTLALKEIQNAIPLFDEKEQNQWRKLLLTVSNGQELVDKIFYNDSVKPNEAP
jgi:hypothetical protein